MAARAAALRVAAKTIVLEDGSELDYDGLVIATGVRARTLGRHPVGVHTLRTLGDALRLRAEIGVHAARSLAGLHARHGVGLVSGTRAAAFEGTDRVSAGHPRRPHPDRGPAPPRRRGTGGLRRGRGRRVRCRVPGERHGGRRIAVNAHRELDRLERAIATRAPLAAVAA
ncbi:hypothetical protein ACFVMC_21380 [Nocardia sp. NPDC127579]|uniref:hypothetical protein n=1 Tax=Nocardia sp. NPDC127579 TaxID=3345402 RepID=UPI0036339769